MLDHVEGHHRLEPERAEAIRRVPVGKRQLLDAKAGMSEKPLLEDVPVIRIGIGQQEELGAVMRQQRRHVADARADLADPTPDEPFDAPVLPDVVLGGSRHDLERLGPRLIAWSGDERPRCGEWQDRSVS